MAGHPSTLHRPQGVKRRRGQQEVIEVSSDNDRAGLNSHEMVEQGLRTVGSLICGGCGQRELMLFPKEVSRLSKALEDKDRLIGLLRSQAAVGGF